VIHSRRAFRPRIPFKKTILFIVLVLVLLSAADQIASAVNRQRQALWSRAVHGVEHQIEQWQGKAGGRLTNQLGNRLSGNNGVPGTGTTRIP
jgi:hypothetical protein